MSTKDISIIKTNWGSKTIYVFYSYVSSNTKIFSYDKWLKSSEILLSRDIEVRILYSTCLHLSSLSFKQKYESWEGTAWNSTSNCEESVHLNPATVVRQTITMSMFLESKDSEMVSKNHYNPNWACLYVI